MSPTDNSIDIEFYGVLTEQAGCATLQLPLTDATPLATVLEQLAAAVPAVADYLPTTACAVDDAIVQRNATIKPGAKLALLPPVSGG